MRTFSDSSGNGMGVAFTKQALLEEELEATGSTTSVRVNGNFNASLHGTFVADLVLARSLDDGATWQTLSAGGETMVFDSVMSESFFEPEPQALYRWTCTEYTSGTVTCRIGK